jgi:hypothetical protein
MEAYGMNLKDDEIDKLLEEISDEIDKLLEEISEG